MFASQARRRTAEMWDKREFLAIDTILPYAQFAYDLICNLAEDT